MYRAERVQRKQVQMEGNEMPDRGNPDANLSVLGTTGT